MTSTGFHFFQLYNYGEIVMGDLVPQDDFQFQALIEGSDLNDAIQANCGSGALSINDLSSVPMPLGGSTSFIYEDVSGNEVNTKTITGVLCFFRKVGALYGTTEVGSGVRPVLVTNDCVTAHRVNDSIGDLDEDELEKARIDGDKYRWNDLSYCQFGSAPNGRGKRCTEKLHVGVLCAGEAYPVVVKVSAASIGRMEKFVKLLSVPYWRAVVELSLVKAEGTANPYSMVKPRQVDALNKQMGDIVLSMYTNPMIASCDSGN